MGSRRKTVDRYYLAELRSELNERLDVEKARDRATYFQFELCVRMPGNLGRIWKSSLPRKFKERNRNKKIFAEKLGNKY